MMYDSANDAVVINKGAGAGTLVYDPKANEWITPENTFPKKLFRHLRRMMIHGFYDPELNVHFCYMANDSSNAHARMLVYRYKRAEKQRPAAVRKKPPSGDTDDR